MQLDDDILRFGVQLSLISIDSSGTSTDQKRSCSMERTQFFRHLITDQKHKIEQAPYLGCILPIKAVAIEVMNTGPLQNLISRWYRALNSQDLLICSKRFN